MSALENALEKIEPYSDYTLGIDPSSLGSDATAQIEYMLAATGGIWQALPADIRGEAIGALETFGESMLSLAGSLVSESAEEAFGQLGQEMEDVAGPVSSVLMKAFLTAVSITKLIKDTRYDDAAYNRARMRMATLGDTIEPNQWTMRAPPVRGYAQYVPDRSNNINWSWMPCLPLDDGESRIYGINMDKPKGKIGKHNGVGLSCPLFLEGEGPFEQWGGCNVVGNPADRFEGNIFINALSWPWWSPSFSTRPMQVVETGGKVGGKAFLERTWDPNQVLIQHQILILTDPRSNMQVSSGAVERYTQNFVDWWATYLEDHAPGRIDGNGYIQGPYDTRWIPDAEKKPNAGDSGASRFYFDGDGLIRVYDAFRTGENRVDLAEYGVPIPSRNTSTRLGCSMASYNAVVEGALAFFTARSGFLRNESISAGIVRDGMLDKMDSKIHSAIVEAAQVFEGEIAEKPARKKPARKTPGRKGFIGKPKSGGAALLGIGAIGLLGLYFLGRR